MKRDFLTLDALSRAELDEILHLSATLKRELKAGRRKPLLAVASGFHQRLIESLPSCHVMDEPPGRCSISRNIVVPSTTRGAICRPRSRRSICGRTSGCDMSAASWVASCSTGPSRWK